MKKNESPKKSNWSRRSFLRTFGVGVPLLSLVGEGADLHAEQAAGSPQGGYDSDKFTPLDLSRHFNASPRSFGPRAQAREMGSDGLIRTPAGERNFWGVPFRLGAEGLEEKRWLVLSTGANQAAARSVVIPVHRSAKFVCMAAFCDWDPNENPQPGADVIEQVGQVLAEATFTYADGREEKVPLRRRFEVDAPLVPWGHLCFAAVSSKDEVATNLHGPLNDASLWGRLQTGETSNSFRAPWICALPNPRPGDAVETLRFEAKSEDPLAVCGLTLFHREVNPLRRERLRTYRFTLPEGTAGDRNRWEVRVDLGVVARSYFLNEFDASAWLGSTRAGLGEDFQAAQPYLYTEVAASQAATLTLRDSSNDRSYEFALEHLFPGRELAPRSGQGRIKFIEAEKVWLHAKVVDAGTRSPTPIRLAFRSKDGRYLPPYGHRAEINDAWFEDYGADLKLGNASFAYVDGTFQVELPVGEVYLEMNKGFEYEAVRKKLEIKPGQRELSLEMPRIDGLQTKGWVSADSHVHFLSPSSAILEGQAEGLNLIHLLAAQWGDLFTNVGDLSQRPLTSRDGQTVVYMGTENRQHLLGHLGALGAPVHPMSAGGPEESYLGDPVWESMAEWADKCRAQGGLAVAAHFPYPTAEIAADVVMGKIDAVELFPTPEFNSLRFLDWYRYLNCGYRLPVVGGTDKMGAYEAVGANRCYAYLGDEEFTFANWAKAVRKGNTFMTSGPFLLFQADGHVPGDEIHFRSGGGEVEVQAHATCFFPFHRLEVIFNGRVVASREDPEGRRDMILKERVRVPGAGWLAARCSSRLSSSGHGLVRGLVAHTSPVYVVVPGQELFSPTAAAYFLTLMDGSQLWTETLATRPDPERFERIVRLFRDARGELHRRLHQHGIAH